MNVGDILIIPDGKIPPPPAPVKKSYAKSGSGAQQTAPAVASVKYYAFRLPEEYRKAGMDIMALISPISGTPIYSSAEGYVQALG